MEREHKLEGKIGVGLVFAPEKALAGIWASAGTLRAFRVDIKRRRDIDFRADLRHLPIVSDSVDLQWCHHVLEHIPDDRAAIEELYRVLRWVTGELIVSVPMATSSVTKEFGYSNNRESGHWRLYGDDFAVRLSECGFTVESISPNFSPGDYDRYGLIREKYYLCRKLEVRFKCS